MKVKYFLTEFGFRLIEPLDMLQTIGIVVLNKEGKYLQKKKDIYMFIREMEKEKLLQH